MLLLFDERYIEIPAHACLLVDSPCLLENALLLYLKCIASLFCDDGALHLGTLCKYYLIGVLKYHAFFKVTLLAIGTYGAGFLR